MVRSAGQLVSLEIHILTQPITSKPPPSTQTSAAIARIGSPVLISTLNTKNAIGDDGAIQPISFHAMHASLAIRPEALTALTIGDGLSNRAANVQRQPSTCHCAWLQSQPFAAISSSSTDAAVVAHTADIRCERKTQRPLELKQRGTDWS